MADIATNSAPHETLIDVNLKFSALERFPDPGDNEASAWFKDHLDERLVFRRASGAVTDRVGYIASLCDPANTTDFIHAVVLDVVESDRGAAVTAIVAVRGKRSETAVDGQFLNRRLFSRLDTSAHWRCVAWWNEKIPNRSATDAIEGAEGAIGRYSPDVSGG